MSLNLFHLHSATHNNKLINSILSRAQNEQHANFCAVMSYCAEVKMSFICEGQPPCLVLPYMKRQMIKYIGITGEMQIIGKSKTKRNPFIEIPNYKTHSVNLIERPDAGPFVL